MAQMLTEQHTEGNALRRYELLSENTRDIVLFIRPDGTIAEANRAAVAAYGYSRRELLHMSIFDLRPPGAVAEVREQITAAFHSGITVESLHQRKDGTTFPVEVSATPSQIGGLLLTLVRDITQRKLWEQTQNLLREVDHSILRRDPGSSTLRLLCRRLTEMFDCVLVWVAVKQPDGGILPAACAGSATDFLKECTFRWDDSPQGQCPTGIAIRTAQPQVLRIDEAAPSPWKAAAERRGFHSICTVPLPAARGNLGALSLYSLDRDAFDPEKVNLLMSFAGQVAISLIFAADQEQIRLRTAALEATANGIVITDTDGRIQWINPAFTRLTGYSAAEALGQNPRILKSGVHSQPFYKRMWDTVLAGQIWAGEIYNRRKDGTIYPEEMTITPIRSPEGKITHFVAVKQDVTERKQRDEQLRYLSLHDPVTELPNRRVLQESLERMVRDAKEGMAGVLMLMDVDDFKLVNDTLGHHAGDALLAQLAQVLRTVLRPRALVARWGGDEFAALVEDITLEEAVMLADEVRRAAVRELNSTAHQEVSVSIGISAVNGRIPPEKVVAAADRALFQAKEEGCNHVAVWQDADSSLEKADNRKPDCLGDALNEGNLLLLFQPVVALDAGTVEHYEAVPYCRRPSGEMIEAHAYLTSGGCIHLLPELDHWTILQGLNLLKQQPDLKLFLPLSEPGLRNQALRTRVAGWLRRGSAAMGRIGLQISETSALQNLQATDAWIHQLMPLGCRFALDEYGVGLGSLPHLKVLPVELLKLDPSLVEDVETDPTSLAVVSAFVDVAHALGKSVAATRVTSSAGAVALRRIGVELAQGPIWGIPSSELNCIRH